MAQAVNYFAWQGRLVLPELGRRVMEVGCGVGNFTRLLLEREAVIAIDAEPDCIERLKERFPGQPNLHAFVADAGSATVRGLAHFQPDSCVCLNVLEHIEDDRAALESMSSVLTRGGAIVLIVPAFQALYGPIDRNLGHCRRYTRRSLAALAGAAGLRIRKLRYMNLAGFFGWWMNARIFRLEVQSPRQIEIFDRSIVPALSRLEGLIPPPFGQSLFAVLRKP